jgi:uncharacterized protein DUF6600
MKTLRRSSFLTFFVALFVSVAALSAFADPPSRAVRLQYISGPVSIQPGGVNDWVEAVVNRPLTTADRIWTDKAARAELHLGSAALRLNAETSMTLTNVSDDLVQVELDQGTLNLHIRHLFGGETYEIDTPNQAFTILKAGDYRFDVDPNADTTSITVWRGEGEANGQGPGVKLKSGHQATFSGGTSLQHEIASAPGLDGFDDWCRVRDDREDHATSYEYVSADVVGADELDEYGTWRTVPEYGAVWVPAVAPGWAPYHYGHWVWVEPWGWTWVDDAPWGYAPCHYGRWVHVGAYWGWAPGPMVVARPVYAPALVAWVGGPHFGVGMSFGAGGGVGWFALGWGEPYVPTYHVTREYFQQVNVTNTHITNITTVTNNYYITNNNTTVVQNNIQNIHYANRTVNGAVTAVPTSAMASSQSVSRVAVSVPATAVRAGAFATAAPVAPARTSVLGTNASVHAVAPPARTMERPVVSHMAPPPKPIPFEAKQEELAKNPGRPLDAQTEAQVRTNVMRQTPAAMNHGTPGQPGNQPAAGQPGMQPVRGGMPNAAQPARPGSPAVTPNPAPDSRPGMNAAQPATPAMPTRNVPRPPQPGMRPGSTNSAGSATAASPATAAAPSNPGPANPGPANRPVPRPPSAMTNGESGRPYVSSSPQPSTPSNSNDSMSRPASSSNAGNSAPRPSEPSNTMSATPRPTATGNDSNTVARPSSNNGNAVPRPSGSYNSPNSNPRTPEVSNPVNSTPRPSQPTNTMSQPSNPRPLQNAPGSDARPSPRPTSYSHPASHPAAESRPSNPQPQSQPHGNGGGGHSNSKGENHSQSKSEHENKNK